MPSSAASCSLASCSTVGRGQATPRDPRGRRSASRPRPASRSRSMPRASRSESPSDRGPTWRAGWMAATATSVGHVGDTSMGFVIARLGLRTLRSRMRGRVDEPSSCRSSCRAAAAEPGHGSPRAWRLGAHARSLADRTPPCDGRMARLPADGHKVRSPAGFSRRRGRSGAWRRRPRPGPGAPDSSFERIELT